RERVYRGIERGAGAHDGARLAWTGEVIAADVSRLALDGVQLVDDLLLVLRQLLGERRKVGLQFRVLALRRKRLRPVHREVKVAAPVVELPGLGRGRLVAVEQLARRLVQRLREQ